MVMVTVCAAEVAPTVVAGKVSDVGDTVICALFTPLPVKATDKLAVLVPCGIVKVPLRDPACAGTNFTVIVQDAPAAKLVPHVVAVTGNSAVLLEVIVPNAVAAVPVLFSVIVPVLLAPRLVSGKA